MPLGHLGIGAAIVRPVTKKLSLKWVLIGTLLPDLIDKPIYAFFRFSTGRCGADIGLISSTRTFAHTGLFCLALFVTSFLVRSSKSRALGWGVVSHLMLDQVVDSFGWYGHSPTGPSALTWPFLNTSFYAANCGEELPIWHRYLLPGVWSTELIGLLVLVYLAYASMREPFKP